MSPGSSEKEPFTPNLALTAILIIIGIVAIVSTGALDEELLPYPNSFRWAAIAILMVIFFILIGKAINGTWGRILIDERKVMSLSRFQILIWTIIILSAYFTIAGSRIFAGAEDPLAVEIDWRLWALLGISSTSLVGTPLIFDSKKRKEIDTTRDTERGKLLAIPSQKEKDSKPLEAREASDPSTSPEVVKGVLEALKEREPDKFRGIKEQEFIDEMKRKDEIKKAEEERKIKLIKANYTAGILFVNSKDTEAKFSDIFEGDEVGNQSYVDVSKVQMFFFTIISALSYVVMLVVMLAAPSVPERLPILPDGLIAILTISHGAYLTNKTVNHTATTQK